MFRRFEWVLAGRYLRARRQEGFISIIAWFCDVGGTIRASSMVPERSSR